MAQRIGTIKVDVSGATRALRSASRALDNPGDALRAAAEVYLAGIRARSPRRTGRLASSFSIRPSGPTTVLVGSDLVYAAPQEFGAWIAPKNKKTLHWVGPGGPVFLRRPVRLVPQPYVGPTVDADTPRAVDAFARQLESSIEI